MRQIGKSSRVPEEHTRLWTSASFVERAIQAKGRISKKEAAAAPAESEKLAG